MPEPPSQIVSNPVMSAPSASVGGKRNSLVLVVVVGASILILAGAVTMLFLHTNSSVAPPTPMSETAVTPATTTPPTPAPVTATTQAATATPAPTTATAPAGTSNPCRTIWTFDQDNGNAAIDATGNGNNATLVGDKATWTKSAKVGSGALNLGGSSYAEAPGAVVNTAQSFTVTAWVNLAAMDKQHNQTFVSMDGNEISGFYLMLFHSGSRFVFNRSDGDDKSATRTMAMASFAAALNTWYHLAGVYDADAKTISLYVNGNLEQTVPYAGAWQATGKTAIGRGFYGHANVDFVDGTIDDVRLYSSALTADEIKKVAE